MQQVTFNINEETDLPFLKKLLESLKGVSNFKVENKSNTVNEDWFDEEFLSKQTDSRLDELLEKSLQESKEGKVTPYNSEEMRKKFKKKNKIKFAIPKETNHRDSFGMTKSLLTK